MCCKYCDNETNEEAERFPLFDDNGKAEAFIDEDNYLQRRIGMPVIDIKPLPNANGNIEQGLKNLCASIPKDTVILCPYISHIFTR